MPAGSAVEATNATNHIDLTEDTACQTCGRTDDADDMLLCARCDQGCHLQCLSPRSSTVPRGDWFCTNCHGSKLQESPEATATPPVVTEESDTDPEALQRLTTTAQEATTFSKPRIFQCMFSSSATRGLWAKLVPTLCAYCSTLVLCCLGDECIFTAPQCSLGTCLMESSACVP